MYVAVKRRHPCATMCGHKTFRINPLIRFFIGFQLLGESEDSRGCVPWGTGHTPLLPLAVGGLRPPDYIWSIEGCSLKPSSVSFLIKSKSYLPSPLDHLLSRGFGAWPSPLGPCGLLDHLPHFLLLCFPLKGGSG